MTEQDRIRDLANQEAERIGADETLTDKEKALYLKELGEQVDSPYYTAEQGYW